jgi:dipeptidyl aminopeptidase/acylaminoacyl peptidase
MMLSTLATIPSRVREVWLTAATAVILLLAMAPALHAQPAVIHQEGYLQPPSEVAEVVTAPRYENVTLSNLSPNGEVFVNSVSDGMVSLEDLARPYFRIAGLAFDPNAQRGRNMTSRGNAGLEFISAADGSRTAVQIPQGARVSGTEWSPDGNSMAFQANYEDGTHVYVADAATGQSRRVTSDYLLATRVNSVEWSGDGQYLFAVVRPSGQGAAPQAQASPTTPLIRVTTEDENNLRTYPSLLKDPHEAELIEYYTTGQLVRIDVGSGQAQAIGDPAMIASFSASPDGQHVRVTTTLRPFSYIVPINMWAAVDEVWDLQGNVLVELERRPIRDGAPDPEADNDEPERRNVTWRPDGQGLSFLLREAAEEDQDTRMDRVMQWLPPFDEGSQQVVYASEQEIRSVEYSPDASVLFLTERQRGTERLYAVDLESPDETHTIYEWDTDDWYANPGSLMTTRNDLGVSAARISSDGSSVYLSGTRYSENHLEQAPRPFVDRVAIRSGDTDRVFESAEDMFERVTAVLDDDLSAIVIQRESPTTVPDSWRLNVASGDLRQLTQNVDHTPDLTAARREVLDITRPDGLTFRIQVSLPADYQEGDRLPAMLWFYPREYESEESYHETLRNHNINSFPSVGTRSMEILLRRGYAVISNDHPIIGPDGRWNDNYTVDLQANLQTVIDAADERGWIDRRRVALGGHSYGGFGTINAMVRTPLFRAGIAGAPNSNRLLTPLSFQRERRILWEARETYLEMSPFLWAERLSGALLIYHGEDDQNVGTFPDNSWRLIHALNGLGKTAALYMYPYEDHGQVAEETLLDMWARWVAWLDYYVKDADPNEPVAPIVAEDQDAVDGPER